MPLARLSRSPSTKRLPQPKQHERDVAAAAAAEEVFKPNKFSTIPHISFFLLLLRLHSNRLDSLYALICRKYKFVMTNCIRSVCAR